jgi:putative isomerase
MKTNHKSFPLNHVEGAGIDRRTILEAIGASVLSMVSLRTFADIKPKSMSISHVQVEQLLKPLLTAQDPAMFQFAIDVYERCVFGRIQAAEPPLRHPWLIPGGIFVGQWLWDTTFLTDLLAIVPDQAKFIRGIYTNFWDFQDRWTKAKPPYARGMVANFIAPDSGPKGFSGKDWLNFPAYSQIPVLAWGVKRVCLRNRDLELVREALPHLEAFHDWYWRERDLDGIGLITVGSYDGVVRDARYETYDQEVDLDSLTLIPHPKRSAGPDNGPWYGDIYIPSNTSYLLLSEQSLIWLANIVGDHALATRRQPILKKGIEAMQKYMWDEHQGCYLAVRREGLTKLRTATIGGMVPLQAGIPSKDEAARMAEALSTDHWNTPIPLPSVDRDDPEYRSTSYWRGDVWPATVFQTLSGLAQYGHTKLVADMAGRLIDNAIQKGISEHYDSQSGAPLGVPNLGMSAVLLTMAIEGLSPRHAIRVIGSA